jgi:hypothetical protein
MNIQNGLKLVQRNQEHHRLVQRWDGKIVGQATGGTGSRVPSPRGSGKDVWETIVKGRYDEPLFARGNQVIGCGLRDVNLT